MSERIIAFLWSVIEFLQNYNGAVTALATAVIAIFTVFLVLVTGRQAKLTRKSVEIARDALITTERAFVFLDDFDVDFAVRLGGGEHEFLRFIIRPRWRNNGTTPTRDMTVSINWTPWPGDLHAEFPYDYGAPPAPMFLAPQAMEWSEAIVIPANVATDALYGRGHGHIFIWGRVDYKDIFPGTRPHFTQWCYRLRFPSTFPDVRTQFVAFGKYNSSDEETR